MSMVPNRAMATLANIAVDGYLGKVDMVQTVDRGLRLLIDSLQHFCRLRYCQRIRCASIKAVKPMCYLGSEGILDRLIENHPRLLSTQNTK